MGKFFNSQLKNMRHIPRGLEAARQDFRKVQLHPDTVGYIDTVPVPPPVAVLEPPKPEMTPAQIRMAKVRAARKNVTPKN